MPARQLDGSFRRVDLGSGYTLVAPGLKGTAEVHGPRAPGTRGREQMTPMLDAALAQAGLEDVRTIELEVRPAPPPAGGLPLRGPTGDDALLLEVPDLGPDAGQVVLAIDEGGTMTWNLPLGDQGEVQPPARRGAGGVRRFLIRRHVPPGGGDGNKRGLVQLLGRKLLKVLVYPVTDPVLGPVSELFAGRWEAARRPYGLRLFGPADYGAPAGPPVDWDRLAGHRALLFVHGTFSTAQGAFGDLPAALMETLWHRYGGRVLAFNHFTLAHDPRQNVAWLLDQVPPGLELEADVVCHSRGGLVARTLAERSAEVGAGRRPVRTRRVVFVGVPNSGTTLADPERMVQLLDRVTTALNYIPVGNAGEVLEGVIAAVKVLGHGALTGLPGLAAMNPAGEFPAWLNGGPASGGTYYGITADYEPREPGLRDFLRDEVMDRIFAEPNDLVVPTAGVYTPKHPSFPIPRERLLEYPGGAGVTHVNYFQQAETHARLAQWLEG